MFWLFLHKLEESQHFSRQKVEGSLGLTGAESEVEVGWKLLSELSKETFCNARSSDCSVPTCC